MFHNFLSALGDNLIQVLFTAFVGFVSYIGLKFKTYYEDKVKDDTKRKTVITVVNAVEQLYHDLKGTEKLNKAKENIILILNEKGITITELEMNLLIEEVCNSFNIKKEDTVANN